MDRIYDPEETIYGRWCYDSETGDKLLIDLRTGQIIARWVKTNKEEEIDGNR